MHFLYQQLCQLVKSEWSRAFQQHHLVSQAAEYLAVYEVFHGLEEIFLGELYVLPVGAEHGANADKLHHAPFADQA